MLRWFDNDYCHSTGLYYMEDGETDKWICTLRLTNVVPNTDKYSYAFKMRYGNGNITNYSRLINVQADNAQKALRLAKEKAIVLISEIYTETIWQCSETLKMIDEQKGMFDND